MKRLAVVCAMTMTSLASAQVKLACTTTVQGYKNNIGWMEIKSISFEGPPDNSNYQAIPLSFEDISGTIAFTFNEYGTEFESTIEDAQESIKIGFEANGTWASNFLDFGSVGEPLPSKIKVRQEIRNKSDAGRTDYILLTVCSKKELKE